MQERITLTFQIDYFMPWHINRFTKEHINLVLFKDCAKTGKQPILDSRCIRKLTLMTFSVRNVGSSVDVLEEAVQMSWTEAAKNGSLPKYKNVCTSSGKNDIKMVGEMVFGTAPLASTGTTIKVHSLRLV
ncbi:FNIP2 [Bugula neritina]|uniref:FNIP2 n=1 Tax=Bugula neritina TaxID=10212 RepID=A0A7J7K9Z5_BUGNE|nr:FNIP2 [Bugula neritina]